MDFIQNTIRKQALYIAVVLLCTVVFSGCASQRDNTYRQAANGTVRQVSEIQMPSEGHSFIGSALGGVGGGFAGSLLGSGSGNLLATLGGAALGSILGSLAESEIRKTSGLELTIEMDDGNIILVSQTDDELFVPGDRVRVLVSSDGRTRVMHY